MINNVKYTIRKIQTNETMILETFLYEAIFLKEGEAPLPREIIHEPVLKIYIENFGNKDDHCFVAEIDGNVVGAVWARILAGDIKGYGNIDDKTPEIAISILKQYRNYGIGTELMKKMMKHLKTKGYGRTSLSVERANYAYRIYEKLGFKIIEEPGNDYLMVLELT